MHTVLVLVGDYMLIAMILALSGIGLYAFYLQRSNRSADMQTLVTLRGWVGVALLYSTLHLVVLILVHPTAPANPLLRDLLSTEEAVARTIVIAIVLALVQALLVALTRFLKKFELVVKKINNVLRSLR